MNRNTLSCFIPSSIPVCKPILSATPKQKEYIFFKESLFFSQGIYILILEGAGHVAGWDVF